jgi:TRAP-type C4-dicarboxylate transport system permease small subunit
LSDKIVRLIDTGIKKTGNALTSITLVMLFVLLILGAGDVIGRYTLNSPITGTKEISSMLVAGIVLLGWAGTQAKGAHVKVELVLNRFPQRTQVIINIVTTFLSLVLFSLIVWQSIKVAVKMFETNRFVLCLEFIIEIVQFIQKIKGKETN